MHVGCKVFEGVVEAVDDGSLVVDDWWDGCELSLRHFHMRVPTLWMIE
jgi:hypothetical protein